MPHHYAGGEAGFASTGHSVLLPHSRSSMLIRRSRPAGSGIARGTALTAVVAGLLAVSEAGAAAYTSGAPGAWTSAGQNIFDTHSQPFEHTTSPANVNTLTPRWTLATAGAVSATPTVAD